MSGRTLSPTRIVAAVVAALSLSFLVDNVILHGDTLIARFTPAFSQIQNHAREHAVERSLSRAEPPRIEGGGGLELIEIVEVCFTPPPNISGWTGLWLVTVLIGGVPTAVLLRYHS